MPDRDHRQIFVSATTNGFQEYREVARVVVNAQGFEAVDQGLFETPTRDITTEIREKIFRAHAALCIVGPFYGYASPVVTPEGLRESYTQFELHYALRMERPCIAIFATPDREGRLGEDEPPELAALQAQFVAALKQHRSNLFGWTEVGNRYEFALALARLRWRDWLDGRWTY